METIRAAGGLLWREDGGVRRVALVHRPRRGDWSLPKGKLEEGESWEQAALREVREETGCDARILSFAGIACYAPRRKTKVVLYWNMELLREGPLPALDEVDKVVWLAPAEAAKLFDHDSDREVLEESLTHRSPAESRESGAGGGTLARSRWLPLSLAGGVLAASTALALWLEPAGTAWLLLGAGTLGAVAGAAATRFLDLE